MKLLVDMNLSPHWIAALNKAGWEAVHWSAVGRGNALDSEIMLYAAQNDYVVLTHDMDFSAILAATHGEKPSVVQLPDRRRESLGDQRASRRGPSPHGIRVGGWRIVDGRPEPDAGTHVANSFELS
jgi:Domain of unknown function (DUF5615)